MLLWEALLIITGIIGLWHSSQWLVTGSLQLAHKFKLPTSVVGLSLVAFGTSMPELLVSLFASNQDAKQLAIGNLLGSNIANVYLLMGVCALIKPLKVARQMTWKEIPFSFLGAWILLLLGTRGITIGQVSNLWGQYNYSRVLNVTDGLILLSFYAIFLYYLLTQKQQLQELEIKPSRFHFILLITLGIIGLGLSSQALVNGSIGLASAAGLSQNLVGLTIVALGTSLPELVTSLQSLRQNQPDLAIANAIGSNITNILGILGVTLLTTDLTFTNQNLLDVFVTMFASMALLCMILLSKPYKLGKIEGTILLGLYILYLTLVIWRN